MLAQKNTFKPNFNTSSSISVLTSTTTNTISEDNSSIPTESIGDQKHDFLLASQSLTSRSEDSVPVARQKPRDMTSFQQLDEIFDELISPPKPSPLTSSNSMSRGAFELMDSSDDENNDKEKTPSPLKSRMSLGKKSVSWIPPRNTSPLPPRPTPSETNDLQSSPLKVDSTIQGDSPSPQKKMTRCRSQIISLVDGNAPPLPYNIRSKKRVARRIQSIHHLVEPEDSPPVPPMMIHIPDSPMKNSMGTTTDDDITTISGGSGSGIDSHRRPSLNSSEGGDSRQHSASSTPVRSRVKYVPCRLQENAVDLSKFARPLTVREQTRIATLLSTQEAQFGFNMFDALIPGDTNEVNRLLALGYAYEDAVLMIFEKRYVTKPGEQLGGAYYSAPTSPNISYDYSINPNAADLPNYSADYASHPSMSMYYHPPEAMTRRHSMSSVSSRMSGYTSGHASTLPPPQQSMYYPSAYPIAYAPYPAYVVPVPVPMSPASPAQSPLSPVAVSVSSPPSVYGSSPSGLPPKSPKATGVATRSVRSPSSASSTGSQSLQLSRSGSSVTSKASSASPAMTKDRKATMEGNYAVPTVARLALHNA